MKKTAFYILVLAMASMMVSSFYAENAGPGITGEEALEIALQNSRQLAIYDLEIDRLEKAYERVKEEVSMLPDAYGRTSVLSNKMSREIRPFEAETALEVAKRRKEDDIKRIETNINTTILDILLAKKALENEGMNMEIQENKHAIMMERYKHGYISEHDKIEMEYSMENRRLAFERQEKGLEALETKLKNLLGYSFDQESPEVEGKIEYKPYGTVSVDVLVELAIDNDTSIYSRERSLESKQIAMEITADYYSEGEATYDDAWFNLKMAEADLENAKIDLEMQIRNMYNNLLNLSDNVLVARGNEEFRKKLLDIAEEKLEKGFISGAEYMDREQEYRDAALATLRAECEYMKLKADFMKWTD